MGIALVRQFDLCLFFHLLWSDRLFANLWEVKNLEGLADGPTLYVRCQTQGILFRPPIPYRYRGREDSLLAFPLEISTGQKLTNGM
jgi:hypothetical protein